MANTILTPTAVTREALRVLHQKLTFIGSINRQYDDQFAITGAKIGDTLKIRLPNQYTVTSGATLVTQDVAETSVSLQIATQKHVGMNFTSVDLTLPIDDFSSRFIEPAMAVLAANIEADALNMRKDVYQQVNNIGAAATFAKLLGGRKMLNDSLAPLSPRAALLCTQDNVDLVDALKLLYQDSKSIAAQYRDGVMGSAVGFDFMESTHMVNQLRGTGAGYLTSGANQTGASITVGTGTGSINQGEIVTFVGCNSVHPETKADTGRLQQFTVTQTYAGTTTTVAISPAIVTSGATQNVTASPTTGQAMTIIGTASTNYGQSMLYHKDAFTFATADLVMPKGVDFGAREVYDGISLRIIRDYDITNDKFPCRIDILYGYKTLRAQLAARLANN